MIRLLKHVGVLRPGLHMPHRGCHGAMFAASNNLHANAYKCYDSVSRERHHVICTPSWKPLMATTQQTRSGFTIFTAHGCARGRGDELPGRRPRLRLRRHKIPSCRTVGITRPVGPPTTAGAGCHGEPGARLTTTADGEVRTTARVGGIHREYTATGH